MAQREPEGGSIPDAELANLDVFRRQAEGAAHTLNNVFTAMFGELALLADERKDDPVVDETIAVVHAQLDRCVKLVRSGLVRQPLAEPALDEVDLGLLLSRCLQVLEGTLPRRVRLSTRVPDEPWLVLGDATELEVLLLGLVFRMGDLAPGECVDVRISLSEGSGVGSLALHLDLEAQAMPNDARLRLVDPSLGTGPTAAVSLRAIHSIADRHGSHLQTERTGAQSLRLTLEFQRLEA